MMVEIFIVVDERAELWNSERVQGRCPLLSLESQSSDEEDVCEHLKGAALMAIGNYEKVPDKIEFLIRRKVKT